MKTTYVFVYIMENTPPPPPINKHLIPLAMHVSLYWSDLPKATPTFAAR